jgi:hypothetical protein
MDEMYLDSGASPSTQSYSAEIKEIKKKCNNGRL